MSFNPAGAQAVQVQTFGSWVTEMQADSLPEGVSPDNQDMVFVPGSAGSRPALQKVYPTPFPSGGPGSLVPTVVYGKSFVTPTGDIKNLAMDSNGSLWVEDLTNSPGVKTLLLNSTPGSFCRSLTVDGREFLSISDGLHGAEMPIQYDGTYIDRVTQDGPATPPVVTSLALPSSTLTNSSAATTTAITSIATTDPTILGTPPNQYSVYTSLTLVVASTAGLVVGENVTISGATGLNGTQTILQIIDGTHLKTGLYGGSRTFVTATGGTLTGTPPATLVRTNNTVFGVTSTAHNLQIGYQGLIAGMDTAALGGGIASIVISNETNPGIATVTTNAPHGLLPLNQVSILGVVGGVAGTAITNIAFAGDLVTVTTSTAHGLQSGSEVIIAAVTNTTVNGQWVVVTTPSANTFTFVFVSTIAAYSAADTGTVTYIWPLVTTGVAPNYFTVDTAPTPTTFTVSMNYPDGTWTGGTVTFAWDGTFYINSVPSPTSFTYKQYGPNASSTVTGTVTPYGQCAPGLHLCRMSYITRQGQQTRPSPYTQFEAAGGQYVSVTGMAIGPSNIVARVLEFTGAQGSFFLYIPVPAQVNGQVVSTATQINDNTTTAVLLDFGDPTLYSAIGTSTPTYNTAQQFTLEGCLGFLDWKQRLSPFGYRNTVNNFLNMGFDADEAGINNPQGWNLGANPTSGVTVAAAWRPTGTQWRIALTAPNQAFGQISQSAYQDCYGGPILESNLVYKIRVWLDPYTSNNGHVAFVATLSSASTGFTSTATVPAAAMTPGSSMSGGSFCEAVFSVATPQAIPPDMLLTVYATMPSGNNSAIIADEMFLIPTETPYIENLLNGSYLNAPEQFNGVTGEYGPPDDTHKIMDGSVIRNALYLLTQDPEGRLHEVIAGNTEPAGWDVEEVDSACGAISAFTMTKSQADNRSASGGEEWFAWASISGPRIFGGSMAHKIGQEIQSAWFDQQNNQVWPQLNPAAALTAWALNDPSSRTIWFGLPLLPVSGTGGATAPNIIYPVNYRELDSAEAIAASPPFHPSFAGRLIATDNTRKWTRWNLPINGAALMYRAPGVLSVVFFGGNGQAYGAAAGFGNIYTLNPAKFTDDDYGQIFPYYVTAALPSIDQEQALQLDSGRKQVAYLSAMVAGTGNVTVTLLCDNLQNPWALTGIRTLALNPKFDLEWSGGSCVAQRIFIKFASSPVTGTDNGFTLRKVAMWLRKARLMVRGSAQ